MTHYSLCACIPGVYKLSVMCHLTYSPLSKTLYDSPLTANRQKGSWSLLRGSSRVIILNLAQIQILHFFLDWLINFFGDKRRVFRVFPYFLSRSFSVLGLSVFQYPLFLFVFSVSESYLTASLGISPFILFLWDSLFLPSSFLSQSLSPSISHTHLYLCVFPSKVIIKKSLQFFKKLDAFKDFCKDNSSYTCFLWNTFSFPKYEKSTGEKWIGLC